MLQTRQRARRGFTILEILIAIVVLVLGITGILALFPTAIDSGNKTVEDSYSAAITQSVVDAVAVGLRESRYSWSTTGGTVWTYFIFNHDGVIDQAPELPENLEGSGASGDQMWRKDYCVILPRSQVVGNNIDPLREPVFIYPVPNQNSGGDGADPDQRKPTSNLESGTVVDNFDRKYWNATTVDDTEALWISRTYQLGRYRTPTPPLALPSGAQPGDVRLEYRGEDLVNPSSTSPEAIAVDPYCSYSFTFAIRRARVDTNGDGQVSPGPTPRQPANPPADFFSNSLYELRVMVFKNFNQEVANQLAPASSSGTPTGGAGLTAPKTNVPIKEFITLISI